jgi:hypothetical protein
MLPNPNSVTIEQAPNTVLFPGDAMDQIFHQGYDHHSSALFRPMWEYSGRRNYSYIFMTRELLNLLHTLQEQGLINGVQAEFGCSPWPATNIWFEDASNASLPDEARYGLTETYWADKYTLALEAIRTAPGTSAVQNPRITRLLVDYHFMVHQLAYELPDRPITAEMELRAFNNEKDALYDSLDSCHDTSHIGFRMGVDPESMARLRQLNELSFESAKRRAAERQGIAYVAGQPFINGAVLSSLFNYIPWKAFLRKLDESLLPGALLVVYNAKEGERAHLDWKNIAADQETIAAFIRDDLGYAQRIHELRKDAGPITPLYLVAQKPISVQNGFHLCKL